MTSDSGSVSVFLDVPYFKVAMSYQRLMAIIFEKSIVWHYILLRLACSLVQELKSPAADFTTSK